jgi:hypothetical protein
MNTEIPAVIPAESASATESVTTHEETPEVGLQERLNNATEEEYKTWERTGDIPPVKPKAKTEEKTEATPPKTDAPAAPKETTEQKESSAAAAEVTKPAAAPETAGVPEPPKPQKKRSGDARIQQLLDERKERDREWQSRFDDLEKRLPKPAEVSDKPGSRPAAEAGKAEVKAKPTLTDNDPKTGKPFASINAWSDAVDEWNDSRFEAKLAERFSQTEQQRQFVEQEHRANQELAAKWEPGRKKYADFDTVAGNPDLLLPRYGAADLFLRKSENAAEVMYYLGQHPELLASFYRYTPGPGDKQPKDGQPGLLTGKWENLIDPVVQTIELAKIEARLTAAAPGTAAAAAAAASPKTTPSAPTKPLPPPPTVLAANSSAAGDAVEEAIKKKDFAAYEAEENRRERSVRRR